MKLKTLFDTRLKAVLLAAGIGLLAGALIGSGQLAIAAESGCGTRRDCDDHYDGDTCNACGSGSITCGLEVLETGGGFQITSTPANQYSGVMGSELCVTAEGCRTLQVQCPTNPNPIIKVCEPNGIPVDTYGKAEGLFSSNPCEEE